MAKENDAETKARACETMSEAEIDPPPWTLGVEPHCAPQDKEKKTQDEE